MNKELREIDIASIIVKPRIRENNGDLSTLERSIRHLGLLSPIIVDLNNILIAGGRRLEACRNIGLTRISAFKLDVEIDSMASLDIQSDENLCRQPLTSTELEKQIQIKKSAMNRLSHMQRPGILSKIKKLFGKGWKWLARG